MEENKEILAEEDCEMYCRQCKKIMLVKAGQPIPACCGKPMEIFD
jgi:hypothetical protein